MILDQLTRHGLKLWHQPLPNIRLFAINVHCKKWVLLLVYCTQRLSFYSCAEPTHSRLSKLFLKDRWYAWTARPTPGRLYTLKSRRAAGFPNGVPSFYISGANSNRSSHLSRIVPTTADLSSAFNLQCLSNMFFFFLFLFYLNIPSRSASFTVKCCGLVFFIHLTWIWHKFLPIFKNFSMTFL